jgi:hypothetical protein
VSATVRRMSALTPRAIATLLALTALPLVAYLVARGPEPAGAQGTPVLASPNVAFVGAVPGTSAISGVFSPTAPYFYVSGLDSVSVIDVSNPKSPRLAGKLVNAVFENEAMTLGERRLADGKIQRFVLVGIDIYQASPGSTRANLGDGKELMVVDVTNPASPSIIGRTPSTGQGAVTTSTHTVACMNASCSVAYTAGDDDSSFSIIDLADLTKPRQVKTVVSPAAAANPPDFGSPAGHHWNVDGAGMALHAGAGGTAIFEITDPMNPKVVNATDARGRANPYNDFIHHNVVRPNAGAFRRGQGASVANGNVALITEEDYANPKTSGSGGDEVICDRAGSFQTWEVPELDGPGYRSANPKSEPDKGTMRPLDTIIAPVEGGGGLTTPVGGFCSAHWFDFHQSGIVALAHYQQGLRLIDVRNPRDLKQFGYFTGGATEVWDAYWAPVRNQAGAATGRKSNIVYTVDAVQGVGVFEVSNLPPDLPVTPGEPERGTFPGPPATVAADQAAARAGTNGPAGRPRSTAGRNCLSRRTITITVPGVRRSRLRSARVTVNGKRVRVRRVGRNRVRVTLAKRLKGRYTVRINGRTRGGKRVRTTRRYLTCTAKRTRR